MELIGALVSFTAMIASIVAAHPTGYYDAMSRAEFSDWADKRSEYFAKVSTISWLISIVVGGLTFQSWIVALLFFIPPIIPHRIEYRRGADEYRDNLREINNNTA